MGFFDAIASIWDFGSSAVTGVGDAAGGAVSGYIGGAAGAVVSGAVSGIITGALAGAAVSLISGDDIKTGALRGAVIGGVAGGVYKGFSEYNKTSLGAVESKQAEGIYSAADNDAGSRTGYSSNSTSAGPKTPQENTTSDGLFGIKGLSGAGILKGGADAYQEHQKAKDLQEGKEDLEKIKIEGEKSVLTHKQGISQAAIAANQPGANTAYKSPIVNRNDIGTWWSERLEKGKSSWRNRASARTAQNSLTMREAAIAAGTP